MNGLFCLRLACAGGATWIVVRARFGRARTRAQCARGVTSLLYSESWIDGVVGLTWRAGIFTKILWRKKK